MCSLQRPLGDKTQLRILVEAQAVLDVLALCESGNADLIASDALVFETDANPDAVRRDFAAQAIAKATQFVTTHDHLKGSDVHRRRHQTIGCAAFSIGRRGASRFLLHLR